MIQSDIATSVKSRLLSNNKKKKILFVDDEPDMTTILKMALERVGLDVDAFNDPTLALYNFKPKLYNLVLLDIKMPQMDGFELYKHIKKIDPGVLVWFLTASEKYREELREEEYCALDRGLFFQKPISIKDLTKEIYNRIGST
jgi:DNA-binding NtrC family response regulator